MQLPRVELVRGVSLLAHRSLRRTQPSQSHERSFAGSRILAQLTSKEKKGLRSLANTLQQQKKLNIMQVRAAPRNSRVRGDARVVPGSPGGLVAAVQFWWNGLHRNARLSPAGGRRLGRTGSRTASGWLWTKR